MIHASGMTCIHCAAEELTGLCQQCREDYDVDPQAWVEFGAHLDGIRRWEEFEAQLAVEHAQRIEARDLNNKWVHVEHAAERAAWEDIPF